MNTKSELRAERAARAADLYQSGLSTRDIAPILGVGRSTVSLDLASVGVVMDGPARISKKMVGKPGRRKGAKHTAESRAKMSAAMKGHRMNVGSKRTPEQCENMRKAALKSLENPERREKLRISALRGAKKRVLPPDEREARTRTRNACKRMLRRILTMARVSKRATTEQLLGYGKDELRAHLEAQFRPGMSWSIRGSFHIDHIRPVADFFRSGIFDPKLINALSNLQPLTPDENRKKRDRIITITKAGTQPGIVV